MEIREAIRAVRAALRDLHEVLVDDTATWARASEEFDEQTKNGFTPRQAQNIRDDRGTIMAQFERDDGRWIAGAWALWLGSLRCGGRRR